jgi:predicted N-acetyltransferase YhbS
MQAAVAACFPDIGLHVGDLAWMNRGANDQVDLCSRIDLWETADRTVRGWTFLRPGGGFNLLIDSRYANADQIDWMLDVVQAHVADAEAAGDPPVALYTYGLDTDRSPTDRIVVERLEQRGFSASPAQYGGILVTSLAGVAEPVLPRGYVLCDLSDTTLVNDRVEAERAAFAPSELTLSKYLRVQRTWPYEERCDRVVIHDRDGVVAFCTCWLDEVNGCGLLEPVGVVPTHQRQGLGRAVCLDGLAALRQSGMTHARVGFASNLAEMLYRSLGFSYCRADTEYRCEPEDPISGAR